MFYDDSDDQSLQVGNTIPGVYQMSGADIATNSPSSNMKKRNKFGSFLPPMFGGDAVPPPQQGGGQRYGGSRLGNIASVIKFI